MRKLLNRVIAHRKRFTAEKYREREKLRADYRLLAESLERHLEFASVLDIGCANGFLLEAFLSDGKQVAGVELSPAALEVLPEQLRPAVTIGDFSLARGSWELVCCLEVAEHISPGRSLDLVHTATARATRWIYFTAAPPGQGDHGHINCRPHTEWLSWFAASHWAPDEHRTAALRRDLANLTHATWLAGNSFVLAPAGVTRPT